jgi:hypothetical protein
MWAAKAAGLISKFPCGRKPGPSRRQREREAEEREEALACRRVEFMDARERPRWPTRRGGSPLVIELERRERAFIAHLAGRHSPPHELIEEEFNLILQGEERYGRAVGKEERLACLSWAYNTWRHRQALNELLAQLAQQRKAEATQTSAVASDEGAARPPLGQPPPTDGTILSEAGEASIHAEELAETARLAAEATELIAAIKTRCTQNGCHALDEELARAHELVKIRAASEGVEVTEQALRAAEIDLCMRKLERLRTFQAGMEAITARYHANLFRREAERVRERERGVPMTLFGGHPRYTGYRSEGILPLR